MPESFLFGYSRRTVAPIWPYSLLVCLLAGASLADDGISEVAPFQRGMRSRGGNGVYKTQIAPHWFPQDSGFWYRNDLPGGTTEYIVVDAAAGTRGLAFDHARLAEALKKVGVADAPAERLALAELEFDRQAGRITFRAGGSDWHCDSKTYELSNDHFSGNPRRSWPVH